MEKPLAGSRQAGERGAGASLPSLLQLTTGGLGTSCHLPPQMINQGCLLAGGGGDSGVCPPGPPTHQGVRGDSASSVHWEGLSLGQNLHISLQALTGPCTPTWPASAIQGPCSRHHPGP